MRVVQNVLKELNDLSSDVDNKNLVGIQGICDRIVCCLCNQANGAYKLFAPLPVIYNLPIYNNIYVVGIWGMGGVGKTTIAKVVYARMRSQFEASYFVDNVRERSSGNTTLAPLKEEMFSRILGDKPIKMDTTFTKRRFGSKKILVVFDDVTDVWQIEFLVGDLKYFGEGSQIIITTRDKQVLKNCVLHDEFIFKIEGSCEDDARQLFYRYAFQQNHPLRDYDELSHEVIRYAKGVPLVLKVLGSVLYGRTKHFWKSTIEKLQIIPNENIQKVLKISYDELEDLEKSIFLDIACFLKWEDREFATTFLDACGFYAEHGITILIDKCLVTISCDNKITTHDLLQEMGWEIVRQESTKHLGIRSRLWYPEDIYRVLEGKTVSVKENM
ncbi:TMV resistance protein N-like isoform X2 [Pistacia vera]|nr:TMV resistance protein N-like isoform X2 [Pistacia vera]